VGTLIQPGPREGLGWSRVASSSGEDRPLLPEPDIGGFLPPPWPICKPILSGWSIKAASFAQTSAKLRSPQCPSSSGTRASGGRGGLRRVSAIPERDWTSNRESLIAMYVHRISDAARAPFFLTLSLTTVGTTASHESRPGELNMD